MAKPETKVKVVKDRTVIKVKSTDPENQGPFVLIEQWMFNPDVHVLFDGETNESGDAPAAGKKSGKAKK